MQERLSNYVRSRDVTQPQGSSIPAPVLAQRQANKDQLKVKVNSIVKPSSLTQELPLSQKFPHLPPPWSEHNQFQGSESRTLQPKHVGNVSSVIAPAVFPRLGAEPTQRPGLWDTSTIGEDSDDTMRDLGNNYQRHHDYEDAEENKAADINLGGGNDVRFGDEDDDGYESEGIHSDHLFPGGEGRQGDDMPVSSGRVPFNWAFDEKGTPQQRPIIAHADEGEARSFNNQRTAVSSFHNYTPGISGRFEKAPVNEFKVPHILTRQGGEVLRGQDHSLKQGLSGEKELNHTLDSEDIDEDDEKAPTKYNDISHSDVDLHGTQPSQKKDFLDVHGAYVASDADDDISSPESSPSSRLPRSRRLKTRSQLEDITMAARKRHANIELDYEERILVNMDYLELKNQHFDEDPKSMSSSVIPEVLATPEVTLQRRLQYFRDQSPKSQGSFFSQMTISEWEESGDWFLDEFRGIMSRLIDSRKEKRSISSKFEAELASQQASVQGKSDNIKELLQNMKARGEGVLRGKPQSE